MKKIILGLGMLVMSLGASATQAQVAQETMKPDVVLTCNYRSGDVVGDEWLWDDYVFKKRANIVRKNGTYYIRVSAYNSELVLYKSNHNGWTNIYSGVDDKMVVFQDGDSVFIAKVSKTRIYGLFDCK